MITSIDHFQSNLAQGCNTNNKHYAFTNTKNYRQNVIADSLEASTCNKHDFDKDVNTFAAADAASLVAHDNAWIRAT